MTIQNFKMSMAKAPLALSRKGGREALIALLFFTACADNHIWPSEEEPGPDTAAGIAFSSSVVPSVPAPESRADGSLINRRELQLLPTQKRTYYLWDRETGTVQPKEAEYYVGIYGCYTGDLLWKDMTAPKPTADFFYNQKALVGKDGELSYMPERFWPNNKIGSTDAYQKVSFWAYYPWNATVSGVGDYGISISTDEDGVGVGGGMGKVKFTMHPDAAEQNDFLISELAPDCSKDLYPLTGNAEDGWSPARVPLKFHHMLAQVRLYAFIRGTDRVTYKKDGDGEDQLADADWFDSWAVNETIMDLYGNIFTKKGADVVEQTTTGGSNLTKAQFVALGMKVPDEDNAGTVRWNRTGGTWDVNHMRRRANITYSMSFNNIHTQALYEPSITYEDGHYVIHGTFTSTDAATGSATVNHYIQNPYWFRFDSKGQRVMLNDNYMYDYFEDTPGYRASTLTDVQATEATEQDGINWKVFNSGVSNAMGYDITGDTGKELADRSGNFPGKHYNYAPGNILLVVPQQLTDDDVPNIVITAIGKDTKGNDVTAKVTINMLQMNLKWESSFIYSYAFIDELMPGDDKVRGPETITVVFDPTRETDQW